MNDRAHWRRRLFSLLCLALLTGGQRSGQGGGCSGGSCKTDLSPRTIAFKPGTESTNTFHFLLGASTAVTGQGPIPSWLWATSKGLTAETLLDSNSDGYILDANSMPQFGGIKASGLFDPPGTIIPHWAHLPYTYPDDGPKQKVPLQPFWDFPVRTIRVVDHGLCYARASFSTLAVGLRDSLIGSLTSCTRSTGQVTTTCGGVLRSPQSPTSQPLTGVPVQDQLSWDIRADGVIYTGAGIDCSIRTTTSLDTRLVHELKVIPGPLAGTRVQVTGFNLLTGSSISSVARPPGSVEDTINDNIRNQFPGQLANKINSSLIIPTPGGGALSKWKMGQAVSDPGELNTCKTDSDCHDRHGPEDGCFRPDPNGESLSPSLVTDSLYVHLKRAGDGVCAWRLEPKRINIVPAGIEIVLVDNDGDSLRPTVSLLASLQPGGALVCSSAPPMPMDPLGPDAGGELVAGRGIIKSF